MDFGGSACGLLEKLNALKSLMNNFRFVWDGGKKFALPFIQTTDDTSPGLGFTKRTLVHYIQCGPLVRSTRSNKILLIKFPKEQVTASVAITNGILYPNL